MKERICLALGFFDSVHYGHRVIIDALKQAAEKLSITPVLSTFSDSIFTKNSVQSKLVFSIEERRALLLELGIENILVFEFDSEFKKLSPENFLICLTQKYNIEYIVCGYDYRFGCGRKGDIATLEEFCTRQGISLQIIDKVCLDGERVSTSRIKNLLELGDIKTANKLLAGEYFVDAEVTSGRGEGRHNDFPTANQKISPAKLVPKSGVYATKTLAQGKIYTSVTNVGARPSYNDHSFGVETFIDGFSGNLYGQNIRVFFLERLREIQKFDSKLELRQQIVEDLMRARSAFA